MFQKLREIISDLFRIHFILDYGTLMNLIKGKFLNESSPTDFQIILTLRELIVSNTRIFNKYGFVSYLREDRDIYFLTRTISFEGNFLLEYYTENPNMLTEVPYSDLIARLKADNLPIIINRLCSLTSEGSINDIIRVLPPVIQETLLEDAIESHGSQVKVVLREKILKFFSGYIKKIPSLGARPSRIVSMFPDQIRCYEDGKWSDCSDEIMTAINESAQEKKSTLEEHPLGYYGLINPDNKRFCLKETQKTANERVAKKGSKKSRKASDKRIKPTGKNCSSFSKEQLNRINKKAIGMNLYNGIKLPVNDDSIGTKCNLLKDAMIANKMLMEDKTCGTSKKKKD
jgi:hypothetical protein